MRQLHAFSTFSSLACCPFQPEVHSTLGTCHSCSSSVLPAFSAPTLTALLLASINLTPFCSTPRSLQSYVVLHKPVSMQANFTPTSFSTNALLHQPVLTQTLFYTKHLFAETHFYTNQLLHKPTFAQNHFSTNHLWQTGFYTHHFFDKPIFFLHYITSFADPHFGTFRMFWAGKPKARWPVECWRLPNIASSKPWWHIPKHTHTHIYIIYE